MIKPRAICVYCGSSDRGPPTHREAAARLGREMAGAGIELVYGGGRIGLMGVIADAVIAAGGRVTGIIPEHLLRKEIGHGQASELIVVASMHERKEMMFRRADAFVVLPGGAGTLDEAFEILTWRQLRLHDKPVLIANLDGYWDPMLRMIESTIASGYAQASFRDLYRVADRIEDVMPLLRDAPEPALPDLPGRL